MPDDVIDFQGIRFPVPVLHVLLAQSAAADVRRRYEGEGNVYNTIQVNREFQQAFLDSYVQANLDYFNAIKPHIPTGCRRILDIGCGIGLIDLMIYRDFIGQKPELYMFDQSVDISSLTTGTIAPTGFNEKYVFTASLELAASFLKLNGVAEHNIRLCEVGSWKISQGEPFDLIFSRKSWGFHYPLSEYLDDAAVSLARSGVLITDVRSGQGGETQMLQRFSDVRSLVPGRKSTLIIARSNKVPS